MMERRPCVESLHQNGEEEINGINKTILPQTCIQKNWDLKKKKNQK